VIIDGDPANIRDVVNFRLCEIIRRLVGCDTVLVQSAGLGLRLKNGDVMPVNGQSMGSSQTSRSGPDNCDAAAGRTTTFIELLVAVHRLIGRIALQPSNLNGFSFSHLADANLFAKRFRRADAS